MCPKSAKRTWACVPPEESIHELPSPHRLLIVTVLTPLCSRKSVTLRLSPLARSHFPPIANRHAQVIGINEYQNPAWQDLDAAVGDAEAVAQILVISPGRGTLRFCKEVAWRSE